MVTETRLTLLDDTGKEVTPDEVYAAYTNLDAVGYYVKCRLQYIQDCQTANYQLMGYISYISDTHVHIVDPTATTDHNPVPRPLFHKLYEVD